MKSVCGFVCIIDNSGWLTVANMYDYSLALSLWKITQQYPQSRLQISSQQAGKHIYNSHLAGWFKEYKMFIVSIFKKMYGKKYANNSDKLCALERWAQQMLFIFFFSSLQPAWEI